MHSFICLPLLTFRSIFLYFLTQMQQHFNGHVFTEEQSEYAAENIDVAHVEHVDNQQCLDLIEDGPTSILSMTDEEARLPKGSDENLLLRMHTQHAGKQAHPDYVKPKTSVPQFGIKHYAGDVNYNVAGFLVKNQDLLEQNITEVVLSSQSPFVQLMVPGTGVSKVTVGGQFKAQLHALMSTLQQTAPHFIRCIKSNLLKISDTFDGPLVLRQMRYLGLKGVIDIRQRGYPVRRLHLDFFKRYKVLSHGIETAGQQNVDYAAICAHMLQQLGVDAQDWRIGTTKVFIRQQLQGMLEGARESKLTQVVIFLQSCARTKIWRARFLRYKSVEARVRAAVQGTSAAEIDAALEAYEGLQLKVKRELVQQAVQRKAELLESGGASRALDTAVQLRDVTLLSAAIEEAKKHGSESEESFKSAMQLLNDLQEYASQLNQALTEQRNNLELLQYVVQCGQRLELNGPQEQQAAALLVQLQLDMAQNDLVHQRDVSAIKHALSIAMQISSGPMVGVLLHKANAKFGEEFVQGDGDLQQAQQAQGTFAQEIADMENELQAAVATDDFDVLSYTIEQANMAAFISPTLDAAQGSLQQMQARDECLKALRDASASRSIPALEEALTLASNLQLPRARRKPRTPLNCTLTSLPCCSRSSRQARRAVITPPWLRVSLKLVHLVWTCQRSNTPLWQSTLPQPPKTELTSCRRPWLPETSLCSLRPFTEQQVN